MSWLMWGASVVVVFVFIMLFSGLRLHLLDKETESAKEIIEFYLSRRKRMFEELEDEFGDRKGKRSVGTAN